jgi:hypothetical protein
MVIDVSTPSLTAILAPFSFLVGSWSGPGQGLWARDPQFLYREKLSFTPVPNRALIRFSQISWDQQTGDLSHSEEGFIRVFAEGEVELVVAIPAGYTEVHRGRLLEQRLQLEMVHLGVAPRALPLVRTRRTLELADGRLHHTIEIAVGQPEPVPHVASVLSRQAQ